MPVIAVMYPSAGGATFDESYYTNSHLALVRTHWPGMGLSDGPLMPRRRARADPRRRQGGAAREERVGLQDRRQRRPHRLGERWGHRRLAEKRRHDAGRWLRGIETAGTMASAVLIAFGV